MESFEFHWAKAAADALVGEARIDCPQTSKIRGRQLDSVTCAALERTTTVETLSCFHSLEYKPIARTQYAKCSSYQREITPHEMQRPPRRHQLEHFIQARV